MICNFLRVFIVLVSIIAVHAVPSPRSFNGYKVYRLTVKSQKQLDALKKLHHESDLDFWTSPRKHGFTDVMVSEEQADTLFKVINGTKMRNAILINDVQSLVTEERQSLLRAGGKKMDWTNYQSYPDMISWMKEIEKTYPEVASVLTIGKSTEGRNLTLVKISTGASEKKRAIFIDGAHHAREWISPAVVTYMIYQLVKNPSMYSDILDNHDIYCLPVVNPDGYEYSRTSDRMWRRTRSDHKHPKCRGVDPNRNYDFHYGGEGTSSDRCSEIYKGPEAFSEPETRAIRDFLLFLRAKENCIGYFTFHSYGLYWLSPWGYTSQLPDDYDDLMDVAKTGTGAIEAVYGTKYTMGSSTNVLYAAAGGSDDYAKGVAGIKYAYTVELRDSGRYGFLLPPTQILPTCEETWNGLQAVMKRI